MRKVFPLLIAEIANCHGGSSSYMNEIVNKICMTSVDAVKFQLIIANELFLSKHSQYNLFKSFEFGYSFWKKIVSKVKSAKKLVIFDIFGYKSLSNAIKLNADMFKIYASDFDNLEFIKEVIFLDKPVYLSTGGATLEEIDRTISICKNKDICLMAGFQSFPTPVEESHLDRIEFFKKRYNIPVGYMDHSDGRSVFSEILPCIAISKGAVSIEKHVYLRNRKKRYDWQSAMDPEKIDRLQKLLEHSVKACGDKEFIRTELEKKYFESKRRCAVTSRDLRAEVKLKKSDVKFLWGENVNFRDRITRDKIKDFIGRRTKCKIERGTTLSRKMFL